LKRLIQRGSREGSGSRRPDVNPSAGIGVPPDTPDVEILLSVPIRLNLL